MQFTCPKCGRTDALHVNVLVTAKLIQTDDNVETDIEGNEGDHEWDADHIMWCDCGASERSSAFHTKPTDVTIED